MQASLSVCFWVADETASIFQYNLILFDADRMSKCLAKKISYKLLIREPTIQILIIITYGQVTYYLFQFGDYWPMVLN